MDDELTMKQYLEKFVPNLTPDEFEVLHHLYYNVAIDYEALEIAEYPRGGYYLLLREFAGWIDKPFGRRYLTITEAGRAKYRELTAASSTPPADGVE